MVTVITVCNVLLAFTFAFFMLSSLRLNDLWMISGDVNKTTRLTPQCERVWFSYAHLHGLMMGVAWGLLLPLGFLIARYYKNSKMVWFVIHVTLQVRT